MKYVKPTIEMNLASAATMIAETLRVFTDEDVTVDGGEGLTKENNAWDIWGED
ncbi:MAG: hypothetical protein J6W03_01245 [Bacteroidaceae bacterium]|nr:hypothetical protein [Bacteroidaceae bacterium]